MVYGEVRVSLSGEWVSPSTGEGLYRMKCAFWCEFRYILIEMLVQLNGFPDSHECMVAYLKQYKKAALLQGNRAMPKLFLRFKLRQRHPLQVKV